MKTNPSTKFMRILKSAISTLLGAIFLSSCAVTPEVKDRETIAYHGNEENAGVIGFLEDGSLEVDQELVNAYNELIAKYGTMFVPALNQGDGIAPIGQGSYSMTLEAAENYKRLKNFHTYMQKLERAKAL
jgi:hypothetical protein